MIANDGTFTMNQSITIIVTDGNDNVPVVVAEQSFNFIENAANGSTVGTIVATDIDTNTTFQDWSVVSGNLDNDQDGQPAFLINDQSEVVINDADDLEGVSGELQLEITVSDGLFSSSRVTLILQIKPEGYYCDIFIPNVFTPNNDGKNDLFQPLLHQRVQDPILRIYNRRGTLVHKDQTLVYWDGTLRGDLAASGNYYWTLSYICTQNDIFKLIQKKGWVTLIRSRSDTR